MARSPQTRLSQPLFQEPTFGENGPSHDPTAFSVAHPSDSAIYKQIGDLAKKKVVAVPPSRQAPQEMYSLASAYGALGPQVIDQINKAKSISFHALGDPGRLQCAQIFQRAARGGSGHARQRIGPRHSTSLRPFSSPRRRRL